jgi:predicted Holliday junction resolvase-like endonuclease
MLNSTVALIIFIVIVVFLLAGIIYAITAKNTTHSGSFASMAAMQDFQPKDKQRAMEVVIQQKEKKQKEDESGE